MRRVPTLDLKLHSLKHQARSPVKIERSVFACSNARGNLLSRELGLPSSSGDLSVTWNWVRYRSPVSSNRPHCSTAAGPSRYLDASGDELVDLLFIDR
jgi:hypothetical protein